MNVYLKSIGICLLLCGLGVISAVMENAIQISMKEVIWILVAIILIGLGGLALLWIEPYNSQED